MLKVQGYDPLLPHERGTKVMESNNGKNDEKVKKHPEIRDMDEFLDKRARMDALFQEKFTRVITVMFTDLKGSTTITEMEGDLAARAMLKQHNDTLVPIIERNKGKLVKTMGDGTMSYFENAQDAVRAAVQFQRSMDELNMQKRFRVPILVRIGLNTGKGIVEKNDIYGDVVNVASRFESTANPGEICISENTYDALTDKSEIYCRFVKTATLKGKKEPFKVYKVFWDSEEIEKDKARVPAEEAAQKLPKGHLPAFVKLLLLLLIPAIVVLILIKVSEIISLTSSGEEKRSLRHTVTIPEDKGRKGD